MRGAYPHTDGFATNPSDGVRIFYEVFGPKDAERTLLFLPTWTLVHSRIWKAQVPYFSRCGFRVVTFDNRGNGMSDRPPKNGYGIRRITEDALAVMDAAGMAQAAIVGFSGGGYWAIALAAEHAERVSHVVFVSPSVRLGLPSERPRPSNGFFKEMERYEDRDKFNIHYWRKDYPDFLHYWAERTIPEPHSTKQREDLVGWGLETNPEVLIKTMEEGRFPEVADLVGRISCPTLILHGTDEDAFTPAVARDWQQAIPGSERVQLEGSGHTYLARDPVKFNLLLHEFLGPARPPARTWT